MDPRDKPEDDGYGWPMEMQWRQAIVGGAALATPPLTDRVLEKPPCTD